jgi:hypothetical protein
MAQGLPLTQLAPSALATLSPLRGAREDGAAISVRSLSPPRKRRGEGRGEGQTRPRSTSPAAPSGANRRT